MKLTYRNQVILTVAAVLLSNTLGTLLGSWEVFSIGFCAAGLLWILHPVLSEEMREAFISPLLLRFVGLIIFAFGAMKIPFVSDLVVSLIG